MLLMIAKNATFFFLSKYEFRIQYVVGNCNQATDGVPKFLLHNSRFFVLIKEFAQEISCCF